MGLRQVEFEEYWQRCCTCGVWFGVDRYLDVERRNNKTNFFCPNGHSQAYRESEADRLRKQLQQEQQKSAMEAASRRTAEDGRIKAEKELKRIQARTNAGVCTCCNRTFQNLARHMKTKHKEHK